MVFCCKFCSIVRSVDVRLVILCLVRLRVRNLWFVLIMNIFVMWCVMFCGKFFLFVMYVLGRFVVRLIFGGIFRFILC